MSIAKIEQSVSPIDFFKMYRRQWQIKEINMNDEISCVMNVYRFH